jgi:hypothetical protein
MFNWRRMFTDVGYAMAMTEPMCYSYYLASRIYSTNGEGGLDCVPSRMALRSLRDGDPARPRYGLNDFRPRHQQPSSKSVH